MSSVLCGIEWVLQNQAAAVINLSLDGLANAADSNDCNGTEPTSALHQAVCNANSQGKNACMNCTRKSPEPLIVSLKRHQYL